MESLIQTRIPLPAFGAIHPQRAISSAQKTVGSSIQKVTSQGLLQLLQDAASSERGVTIYQPGADLSASTRTSYKQLLASSEEKAKLLYRNSGLTESTVILIHFDSHAENIAWFWAVIRAGFLPVMSTPFSADENQRKQHLRHLKILLDSPAILTSERLALQSPEVRILELCTVQSLYKSTGQTVDSDLVFFQRSNEQPAVLMLTSGSTGNAKAVPLYTAQIISSIKGKASAWKSTATSTMLNWIGLDHVANLTEIHLHAMLLGAEQIHVQADDILADPLVFLRLIEKHRVSHTFAPNFFLALLGKRLFAAYQSQSMFTADLSCLQSIMSGGEANVVETANALTKQLNALGTQGQVIRLGYGLTEACAALIYGMLDPVYEAMEKHEFASIGKPIVGAEIRITTDGRTAGLYEIGTLEISGPVLFSGYFNDPTSTAKAFTADGWFITGDRAYIDTSGKVNLTGREKEVIVINGVKIFPQDIENAIEKANLPGVIPSYIAAFSYRRQGGQTEGYCIVYGSPVDENDPNLTPRTAHSISRITSALVGVSPEFIIPLPQSQLHKTSLGKLSRSKIRAGFEAGLFETNKVDASQALLDYARHTHSSPKTETEIKIVRVLCEMIDTPFDAISVDRTIFELGISSIRLFRFEQALRKNLDLGAGASVITLLSNPIIRSIANAVDNQQSRQYNPVVQLRKGSKNPLWLVHPASGNVLAFLPLARTIKDRPLYALTARGLSNNETLFSSISEMSDTYFKHVKSTQPVGPYALTGYSLGTTVAYEIAKRLEANGDEVAFCAALDSPPHVIPLVEHLDWTAAAVLVSYFLELIPQSQVPELIAAFRGLAHEDTIQRLLNAARSTQREKLNLDLEQLLAIVNVTDNFGTMAKTYEPKGSVAKVDVFYCTPLHSVERNRETWIADHLGRWQDFSRARIELHECEGDHAEMLNPEYIEGFEKRLNMVLQDRGI